VDRRDRQVQLEALPRRAVVEREIEPGLRAGVEQAAAGWVGPNDAREGIRGDAAVDVLPGLAVVAGLV